MTIEEALAELDLSKERRDITIIKGATKSVTGSYCFCKATPMAMERFSVSLRTLSKEDGDFTEHRDAVIDMLLSIGFEWNLCGNDQQPIPITRDALREVAWAILREARDSVLFDSRPEEDGEQTSPTA